MSTLPQVIFFSLIGGVFSLIGGFILLTSKKNAKKMYLYATPFAAGALLAAAFIDLLPEAMHNSDSTRALTWTLVGILIFFFLERFLRWFHHHHDHDHSKSKHNRNIPLVIIGDVLHNFIDGIAIAAGFLVSPESGIAVTIAVAAHEIPQEIGDFGLLLSRGMSKKRVIIVNVLSALATTVAAVLFFTIGTNTELPLDILLGLVAGFFIYIAVSDIIPSIHENEDKVIAGPQTAMLVLGILLVGTVSTLAHGYIDQSSHDHDSGHSNSTTREEEHEDEHEAEHEDDDPANTHEESNSH